MYGNTEGEEVVDIKCRDGFKLRLLNVDWRKMKQGMRKGGRGLGTVGGPHFK
jgi:hypothetical protein